MDISESQPAPRRSPRHPPRVNYDLDEYDRLRFDWTVKGWEAKPAAPAAQARTRGATCQSGSAVESGVNADMGEAPVHQSSRPSNVSCTKSEDDDEEILPPHTIAKPSRKRVIYDSEDEDDDIEMINRSRNGDKKPDKETAHVHNTPSAMVDASEPSKPCPQRIVVPNTARKTVSEHHDKNDKRTFFFTVDPVTAESCVDNQLRSLLRKYQASVILGMTEMGQSILRELDTSNVMTFQVFCRLKKMCYEEFDGALDRAESSLGAWIKHRQEGYLFDLTGVPVAEDSK